MLPKRKILVILLIILLIVAGVSSFFIYQFFAQKAANTEQQGKKVGPIYETQEFTVNASESVNHYIKTQFALELSDDKALKELESKLPLLQDTVIMVLSEQSADVLTAEGKEKLKTNLIKSINSFLDKGTIENIYFKTLLFS